MTREPDGAPLEVLLVEDNPGDLRLVREGFDQSDVHASLTAVTDGEAALDRLVRRDDAEPPPDLALLDLNIPRVNGREVLERVGDHPDRAAVPVIVLTSSRSREDVRDTFELGADGYFVKPVDPNEFMSLVGRVVESVAADGRVPPGEFADLDDDR